MNHLETPAVLPRVHRRRDGQTLIELVVSMTLATVLMIGLGSCLYIASSAFDGSTAAVKGSRAAEVQADMMINLNEAKSITSRSADSITFTVPDRNNDGSDETLTYAWSGLPTAELTYARNGSPPVTLLRDVQQFDLSYITRVTSGAYGPLPPLDPSQWGRVWAASATFGYDTVFPYDGHEEQNQVATRVYLSESGTLESISAYFRITAAGGRSPIRFAIYDIDFWGRPRNLLASTDTATVSSDGWMTIEAPPISLSRGYYYLALSIQRATKVACKYTIGGSVTHIKAHNAVQLGFTPTWGTSSATHSVAGSIYATYLRD